MKYKSPVYNKKFYFSHFVRSEDKEYNFFVTISQLADYFWAYRVSSDQDFVAFKDLTEPTKLALMQMIYNLDYADAMDEFLDDDTVVEDLYNSYGYNQLED